MIGFHRQHLHSFQKRTHHPPPPKHTFFFFGGGVCLVPSTSRSLAERSSTVCACLPWVFYFKKQQPQQQSIFTNSYRICIDCINKQTNRQTQCTYSPQLRTLCRSTTSTTTAAAEDNNPALSSHLRWDRQTCSPRGPTDRPTDRRSASRLLATKVVERVQI